MGLVPLSWQEIESWQRLNNIEFMPWELKVLKAASAAYAHQASISSKADCPPPNKPVEVDQMKLAKHIKNLLR
jgi:hypothetical protein